LWLGATAAAATNNANQESESQEPAPVNQINVDQRPESTGGPYQSLEQLTPPNPRPYESVA